MRRNAGPVPYLESGKLLAIRFAANDADHLILLKLIERQSPVCRKFTVLGTPSGEAQAAAIRSAACCFANCVRTSVSNVYLTG